MYVLVIYNLSICLLEEGMEFCRFDCLLSCVLFVYANVVTCLLQGIPPVRAFFLLVRCNIQ